MKSKLYVMLIHLLSVLALFVGCTGYIQTEEKNKNKHFPWMFVQNGQ